ncbi:MAG: class I SAM-dependent methyltransferase [Mycobacterium sp.]
MLRTLGTDLGSEEVWRASDPPLPDGDFSAIFAQTDNVHKWVHYLPIYDSVLAPYKSRPIRMLEIGVARGGSLQMWRRYLHPDSVIVGIDIDPGTAQFDNPSAGQHVRIGGQQDVQFLKAVNAEFGPFDVILDDGSHIVSHMKDSFRYLFPKALSDGGVYVVEDIHTNYWIGWRDTPMTFIDFTKSLVDAMHAPYQVTRTETEFRVGGADRLKEVRVPRAARLIDKIEFYDSIAVVHRATTPRDLPRTVFR